MPQHSGVSLTLCFLCGDPLVWRPLCHITAGMDPTGVSLRISHQALSPSFSVQTFLPRGWAAHMACQLPRVSLYPHTPPISGDHASIPLRACLSLPHGFNIRSHQSEDVDLSF